MRNTITKIAAILFVAIGFISCNDKTKPQVQFMPDMYTSIAYETYGVNITFANGMDSRLPAKGTIARGHVPYDYPNSIEGYDLAKSELKSPLTDYTLNSEKGKKLYVIYCALCHGNTGDGQGDLVKREKFLGIPNYKDRDLTEGSIYHVIMYGRNLMGSHASQLTGEERWQVVNHVQKLRNDLLK
ncbi:cytochrome c [Flavicella sp.]|uniref:c-type cytochrome n=1 Tax=Flavicella sp. TaxID=2957742 RepID=UPI003017B97D